jgi:nitrite reductase (NADH) small subunit
VEGERLSQERFRHQEVLGEGDLEVAGSTVDSHDGQLAVALEAGCGVRALEALCCRTLVRLQEGCCAERLRGLHADELTGEPAQVAAEEPGEVDHGQCATVFARRGQRLLEQLRAGQGAGPVVDGHHVDQPGPDVVSQGEEGGVLRSVPGGAPRHHPHLAVSEERTHGVPHSVLVARADAEDQPHHVGDGQRSSYGTAEHGAVAEREQDLVGISAHTAAGTGGEDHDGGGHPGMFTRSLHASRQGKHGVPRFGRVKADQIEWQPVCRLVELEIQRGAAALVHGQAVALFRVDESTVYALANHDPFDRHSTLAKGIVGVAEEVPFVASPVHKHGFDLRTGQCLDDPHVTVASYAVRVVEGVVMVGQRKTAAA